MKESKVGWVALCLVPRIGGRTLGALLDAFGSPSAVFDAPREALLNVPRIGDTTVTAIGQVNLAQVEKQIKAWEDDGIHLLSWQDNAYPEPFQELPSRPPLLFARGQVWQNWQKVVAIVGTREPTPQSEKLARNMGRELTRRGWLVVSGLARGIDAAAHQGAVGLGSTVGILGCGVSNVHPIRNRELAEQILRDGVLYAEVPPAAAPSAAALMARNRLISGAAKATIVIEAGEKSGSLEAARRARHTHRHVLTIDCADFAGNQQLLAMEAIPLAHDFSDWDGLAALLNDLPEPPRQLSFFDAVDTPHQLNLWD